MNLRNAILCPECDELFEGRDQTISTITCPVCNNSNLVMPRSYLPPMPAVRVLPARTRRMIEVVRQ